MDFVDSHTIELDKVVNELDRFVLDFVQILEKHCDYVIISGYVAILLGRSRASDDVDVFIKEMPYEAFQKLFSDLNDAGFVCMIPSTAQEAFHGYLMKRTAIRFYKGAVVPNIEVKFARTPLDLASFRDKVTVFVTGKKLLISPIELQIVFKRKVLKSDKDMEDAEHIERVCAPIISKERIKNYEALLKQHGY